MFTPEHDAFILKAHYRSGAQNEDGTWTYSLQSCLHQFNENFPDANIPYKAFADRRSRIIKRFEGKNCICKGKSTGRPTVLTREVVDDIQQRLEQSPQKSLRKLSAQTGVSYGSCHKTAKKVLHLHPYKVTVVQQLHPLDYGKRVMYCNFFNRHLNDNNTLDKSFFTDEAWFHLSGYINSQNYRTWATENPHTMIETDLHPIKVGVWVAISRRRIIGPIFFEETINAERYRTLILAEFLRQLHDDELQTGYFQQDGATAHTANTTLNYLREFYGDRLISKNVWPPRSPDLTPCDFFLFGHLKNTIFRNRMHNLDELKEAIETEIRNITPEQLQNVFENKKRRVNICLQNEGHHFQHLL